MYKYKIVEVKHSIWTGKPKENIMDILDNYSENGWRLVQIIRPNYYTGRRGYVTEMVFEKTMEDYRKDRRSYRDMGELV